ncbi:class I SAM-dependent methyltransferase [Bosea sp. CCNWLW174]|uniref:class I SAM-dependent methyltransferase n=1 Tax=unclassified Bosea (in: a-proteobacteria) TaxID=2653178 RepID=UPI003014E7DE
MTDSDRQKTADHWATAYENERFSRREWIGHPAAQERMKRIMGGHATHAQWFIKTQLMNKPVRRGLGIGVGVAFHENQIVASGAVERYDYFDLSQAGLDLAKAGAADLGVADRITFHCADVNEIPLEEGAYDVITFMASLHHIHELERTLLNCQRALAPGGVLWAFEYVGPDRFDYPDEHTDIARRIYRMLAPELHLPGEPELKFPTPEAVIEVDPTEAVHSSEILPTMRRIWPDMEVHGQYGSLSFMIMWCLNYDYIYDDPRGVEAYRTLIDIETALVDSGQLPHYFVNAIARKAPPLTAKQRLVRRLGIDPHGGFYAALGRAKQRLAK